MSFPKGSDIIVTKPFAYVLSNKERGKRCDYCLECRANLLRCSQCIFAHYCDKICQRQAWKDHKEECKSLKNVSPNIPTDSVRLLARIIFKSRKAGNEPDIIPYGNHCVRRLKDLMSHAVEISRDKVRSEQFSCLAYTLQEFLTPEDIPDDEELLDLFGKMIINSFTICDQEMQTIGTGFYLGPSILNHSCAPNAVIVFQGQTLHLRALQDIPHYDISKVHISYIETLQPRAQRQKQLKDQYYFHCDCPRCLDEDLEQLMHSVQCKNPSCPESVTLNKELLLSVYQLYCKETSLYHCDKCHYELNELETNHIKAVIELCKQQLHKMEELKKIGEVQTILDIGKECLSLLKGFSPLNIYVVRTLDKVFDACIDLQRWEEGLNYGLRTIKPYRTYYPYPHPNFGIQLLKIGKLQLYLQKLEGANYSLQQAESILEVTHGKDHTLFKCLRELQEQCWEEMRMLVITKHQLVD